MNVPLRLGLVAVSLAAFVSTSVPALAVGSGDEEPPKATETTTTCEEGTVWNAETKTCVKPEDQSLNDDDRYRAVRELAYAGRYDDALTVIAAMSEGDTDRVMTYKGFVIRKAGRLEEGMEWYAKAIALNPDNLLARSYRGQAYVEQGEIELAEAELDEIVARGGTGRWPETALRKAIETGETTSY
jgi:tetratricopeptide (TPR) repeat protein